jgi:hypothetical protein
MIALDTEDDSDGSVTIINFYDGLRHTTFVGPECRTAAWNWLLEQAPETVWCCNTEYDLINVFGAWLGKMCTLQYVSAGLFRATLRDASIVFYDTLRHWPMSVKQMGVYLGLPKMERDAFSVEYCRRDTEIVWRFVARMTEQYDELGLRLKATLPSMAMQLWRRMSGVKAVKIPAELRDYFRRGYYGGRVEVYQFGEIHGSTYHYDVNSLFPYVMRNRDYPLLTEWSQTVYPEFSRDGIASVTINLPESYFPCLPVRTTEGIFYPFGLLSGTWTFPEIRQALGDGGKILGVQSAIEFRQSTNPFSRYVDFCYQRRQDSADDLGRRFWKLMLNSLYGKFGQKEGFETIYQDRQYKQTSKGSGYANVIWAAYVTAYARLELLSWLRRCSRVYYTDTDSLFTPDTLPTTAALGGLKREGVYSTCQFVGKKIYTVDGVSKAKGVPVDVAADFIRTGRATYRRPARFRMSRRSFMRPNVWYEFDKHLTRELNKRILERNGTTRPWRIDQYFAAFPEQAVVMSPLSI